MEKKEVLAQLTYLAANNLVTKEELLRVFEQAPSSASVAEGPLKRFGISDILYGIGGAIVFLGIAILVAQNWKSLNDVTKISATLGSGVAAYAVGVFLSRTEKLEGVSLAFFFISALVMPIGLSVTFDLQGYVLHDLGTQSVISGALFGFYLLSTIVFKKTVFYIFDILYGTWFFFCFSQLMMDGGYRMNNFFEYRTLLLGLSYVLLGYSWRTGPRSPLTGPLYGFGVLGFLGAAFALGKWDPHQNAFWEMLFPGLVFGVMFLSVHLKSKSFLTFGSLFLMTFILKITAEYFKTGLGWPFALVLAGFLLIAVGYLSLYLKRKYL